MANWSNEAEAREQIKALVAEYYHDFKEKKADFKPGDRVTYASRVFDEKEMCALTDATLDFWLTTGRFADEFEKEFAKWIGVKFANLVNSGSSANLVAFMALTAPELGDRQIKKGDEVGIGSMQIKEGETSPPKRYNSGAMILAMENAGQLIEDEELRSQIKGSGIGTSATRAEILKKLVNNKYIALNKKTQIYTPTLQGEMIFDVVNASIPSLLNPELTASWEKGLTYVADGEITADEYMVKLENFIKQKTARVLANNNQYAMQGMYRAAAQFYKK